MKKRIVLMLIISALAVLSGCKEKNNTNSESGDVTSKNNIIMEIPKAVETYEEENNYSFDNFITKASEGYYFAYYDGILYYFDDATQSIVPVCDEVNCTHDNENCKAYFDNGSMNFESLTCIDDTLFYLGNNDNKLSLYMMDETANNRTKITDLIETYDNNSSYVDGIIYKGYFYYIQDDVDVKTDTSNTNLYRVKIAFDEKPELIYTEENINKDESNSILNLQSQDGYVYFTENILSTKNTDVYYCKIMRINITTCENEPLFEYKSSNEYNGRYTVIDNTLYCVHTNGGVDKFDLEFKKVENLFNDCNEYEKNCTIQFDGKYLYIDNRFYCRRQDDYTNQKIYIRDLNGQYIDELSFNGIDDQIECYDSKYILHNTRYINENTNKTGLLLEVYNKDLLGTGKFQMNKIIYSEMNMITE